MLELAREAGLKKDHGADREYIGDFDWRHFGELIVRQCASIVETLPNGYQDYRNQIEDAFRRDSIESINRHFGLEIEL